MGGVDLVGGGRELVLFGDFPWETTMCNALAIYE